MLPSSFVGSPRYMQQLYQDAMAIVAHLGKPDLFLTFTCNPNWKEVRRGWVACTWVRLQTPIQCWNAASAFVAQQVKDALLPGQTPNDRPDITAHVLNLKLEALKELLVKQGVLGRVQSYMYTVEFQKRGLPHAHILIILAPEDKPNTPAAIDE